MKYVVLMRFILILLLSFSPVMGGGLGAYLSHESDGTEIRFICENGILKITPILDDIFKIALYPGSDLVPESSFVVLHESFDIVGFELSEDDEKVTLTTSSIRLHAFKSPFRLQFEDVSGTILLSENIVDGIGWDGDFKYARFDISSGEHFYGTGMRGDVFDKSGEKFSSYNRAEYGYDYPMSTMSVNVPFYMSTFGYGVYFDNSWPGTFDFGSTESSIFEYRADNGMMTFYFINGGDFAVTLDRYTWLTGRQPLPPKWALGLLQSKYGYETQEEALEVANLLREKRIPADALILDLQWFGFGNMGNISWNFSNWPTPIEMIGELSSLGLKTILITEPYINESSSNYNTASAHGYLVKNSAGNPYILSDFWSGSSGLLDVTSPNAVDWWWWLHVPRIYEGVGGWWTDLGEPERHPSDMVHEIGAADMVHNIYNLLWARALYEKHQELHPGERFFNLTRSGFAGIQRWSTFTWSGDVAKTFAGLALQPKIMLNMSMSGIGYSHSDIGGFAGWTEPEEYARWMQFGVFSPITRPHSSGQSAEPWQFGTEVEKIATDFIKLRYQLIPYIYTMAWENSTTGIPLVRPLILHYPDDPNVLDMSDEFLFGRDILVAPVLSAGATERIVYFPEGTWIDWWSGVWHAGPKTETIQAPLETMPLFVRKGAIIPMMKPKDYILQSPDDTMAVEIWPDGNTSYTLYEDDGVSLAYQNGGYSTTTFRSSVSDIFLTVTKEASEGGFNGEPIERLYTFNINLIEKEPDSVEVNDDLLPKTASRENFESLSEGWWFDGAVLKLKRTIQPSENAIFRAWGALLTTSIREIKPESFTSKQNYPNPFNASTTIPFFMQSAGEARGFIYNIRGEMVRLLRSAWTAPGDYSMFWDGRDSSGKILPSGIYIIRLITQWEQYSKKIVLLK